MKAIKKIALTLTLSMAAAAPALAYDGGRYNDLYASDGMLLGVGSRVEYDPATVVRSMDRAAVNEVPSRIVQALDHAEEPISITSAAPAVGSLDALLAQLTSLISQLTAIRDQAMATLTQAQSAGSAQIAVGEQHIADRIDTANITDIEPLQISSPQRNVFRFGNDDAVLEPAIQSFVPQQIIGAGFGLAGAPGQVSTENISGMDVYHDEALTVSEFPAERIGYVERPVVGESEAFEPGTSLTQSNTNSANISASSDMAEADGFSVSQSNTNTQKRTISSTKQTGSAIDFDSSWMAGDYLRSF